MNTRRADPNAPLCHWRYMSSPEFKELQAISGTATAKRCALIVHTAKRELIWFIQGLSLPENGGLKKLAAELVKMFPDRIVAASKQDIEPRTHSTEMVSRDEVEKFATGKVERPDWSECDDNYASWRYGQTIEEFLIDLCVNPALLIRTPKATLDTSEFEREAAEERYPKLKRSDFTEASLPYFRDIIGALIEYKRQFEQKAKEEFCQTVIAREIWKQLDEALATRTMILIDGLEGRGKTEAVRAWCQCHLGVARFMSMKGTGTKTDHFREMARALGVGYGNNRKANEMQGGVEEVLRVSKLMPVIDEAHFFFNQRPRIYSVPEMLDWIDTALCNPPSPVALVTTPQFMICMERAAGQVGWNYRQFQRRCKRTIQLPAKNTPEDIEAVARYLLPGADKNCIKAVMAYEATCQRDLSAVGDVAREAKLLAGSGRVKFEHIGRAIREVLIPGDVPWAKMEKNLQAPRPSLKANRGRARIAPAPSVEVPATNGRETTPAPAMDSQGRNRVRFAESPETLAVG